MHAEDVHTGVRTLWPAQVAQRRKKRIAAGRATEEDKQFIEVGRLRYGGPPRQSRTHAAQRGISRYLRSECRTLQPTA